MGFTLPEQSAKACRDSVREKPKENRNNISGDISFPFPKGKKVSLLNTIHSMEIPQTALPA